MVDEHTNLEFPIGARAGSSVLGIFLLCFGMPFTLVPALIVPVAFEGGLVMSIFMVCFSIPFLIAGLFVQAYGLISIWFALFPNSQFAQRILKKRHFGNVNVKSEMMLANVESMLQNVSNTEAQEPHSTAKEGTGFWEQFDTTKP